MNGPDGPRFANIHEQQDAAHLAELLFKQRLQFVHAERGAGQILRIGIVRKNERVLAARRFHGAVPGDQDYYRIVLAGAPLQKILEAVAHRGGGGLFVRQQQHVAARNAAAQGTLQQLAEHAGIRVGELQR